MNALPIVAKLPAIIDRLREIIEHGVRADGSLPADLTYEVMTILAGIGQDLMPRNRGVTCEACGQWYEWFGLLDAHKRIAHWQEAA